MWYIKQFFGGAGRCLTRRARVQGGRNGANDRHKAEGRAPESALEDTVSLLARRAALDLQELKIEHQSEISDTKRSMFNYNAGLLSVMLAVVLGSGYFSLKNITDKTERMAETLKKELDEAFQKKLEGYETEFKHTTDALMVRGCDRATATVYGDLCDDFLNLPKNLEREVGLEWYGALLNSFCDFAEKAMEASKRNYESTALTERENGALIEHDIDQHVKNLASYVKTLLLRAHDADMENIEVVKAEVELLTKRTHKKLETMVDNDEHNAQTYARCLKRRKSLESTKNLIQIVQGNSPPIPTPQIENSHPSPEQGMD